MVGAIGAYIKPYRMRIALGLIIKFLGTLMDLIIPWLLAYIVDTLMPTANVPLILKAGGLMAFCSVIAFTFNVKANRMAAATTRDITKKLRYDLFEHILFLPADKRDSFSASSLISRLSTDTYNVHQLVERSQRVGIRAPLLMLGGMLFTFQLEPHLATVLLLLVPLLSLVIWHITRKGIPLYANVTEKIDDLVRVVRESSIGIRVIKALSKTDWEVSRFEKVNQQVRQAETSAGLMISLIAPAMTFLLNTGFMLVILLGAFRINAGQTQPGKIMAFLSYFTIILNAVLSIRKIFILWSKGSASAQRINKVMGTPVGMPLCEPDHVDNGLHISCESISFSYNKALNDLEDISFSLKRGETLGIIGPTGGGKTTLISLCMRFYDVDDGRIRIDGEDLRSIPLHQLRLRFGAVFQNDVLLADTIYENISFLRDIPRKDVEKAARTAQIADFIESLPQGYDTRLDIRGSNLSGGQKQRLLIARALAANPEILVLDDAQSALDYRTDAALRKAIGQEYANTTMVIVSQRISAIWGADHILLLEEGRLVDSGTHQELVERCNDYRKIVRVQMGGATL